MDRNNSDSSGRKINQTQEERTLIKDWGLDNRTDVLYNQGMEINPGGCIYYRDASLRHGQVFFPRRRATFGADRTGGAGTV
jgi:hypothetical protein